MISTFNTMDVLMETLYGTVGLDIMRSIIEEIERKTNDDMEYETCVIKLLYLTKQQQRIDFWNKFFTSTMSMIHRMSNRFDSVFLKDGLLSSFITAQEWSWATKEFNERYMNIHFLYKRLSSTIIKSNDITTINRFYNEFIIKKLATRRGKRLNAQNTLKIAEEIIHYLKYTIKQDVIYFFCFLFSFDLFDSFLRFLSSLSSSFFFFFVLS
jgi:hypothetical protein